MSNNIKILDCTLRDGGYVNNWGFGSNNIRKIIQNLSCAKLDYIECGFLKKEKYGDNKTLFSSFETLKTLIPIDTKSIYTLMINYGEVDLEDIPQCDDSRFAIRVVFRKEDVFEALLFCNEIKKKGYKVFINPMQTIRYSSIEMLELIKKVNDIKPDVFTIVDTNGSMKKQDILSLYYLVERNLSQDIALAFHSHNNLQLSFSNAQVLLEQNTNRTLIIDTTVFGMGRGAGNLCTELLVQYLNDNYNGNYDILPVLKIIDEHISPIFAQTPWGYSVPYYLAATNHCHPNYAKYLVDKQSVPVEIINNLLCSIPNERKAIYDEELIKQLYLDKFSSMIDDSSVVDYIKNAINNREILILAPGKSLLEEREKIKDFISKTNPFVISLNFEPKDYRSNIVFITNIKRFESLENFDKDIILTSNIKNYPVQAKILNYSSYINHSKMFDNVALMFLELMKTIGVKKVNIAGLDGFKANVVSNYVSSDMINISKIDDLEERNKIMTEELTRISKNLDLNFITRTLYRCGCEKSYNF